MKRYITRFLKTIAMIYLALPLIYPFVVAVLFDIPANRFVSILLSPIYYITGMAAVVAGYGLWEMKRWSWHLFILANILVAYESAVFLGEYGESHHKGLAFMAMIFILLGVIYRVAREVRVPYFFPKIRWWESNPRYKLSVPVKLKRKSGDEVQADILDISMGGCFVKLRTELAADESLSLQFTIFGLKLDCAGIVVWRTQSTVTHPKGVGVKFQVLERAQKRTLRQVNQRLKKIAALYRSSRYLLNQEEFQKRLEEIEANPKAQLKA